MKAYGVATVRGPQTAAEIRAGADILSLKGTSDRPDSPRDLRYLASSRGALIFWSLPTSFSDIVKWRIYKDTEVNMITELSDRGTRQVTIELTSGTTPPVTNIFVTSVNAAGRESIPAHIQAQATAETGAPAAASAPADYTGTGGRNKSYRFYWYASDPIE